MSLKFCSFSSDSSGNCYVVTDDKTSILIDAGISGKKTEEGLNAVGLVPESIKGILLTHEHGDHIKCVDVLAKKFKDAYFYCSEGTGKALEKGLCKKRVSVNPGERLNIDSLQVETFNLSHDAVQPMGYAVSNESGKIVIVTDTGYITEEIMEQIKEADILILEANHETNILKMGNYPYPLKLRILGEKGHLSNEDAAECIVKFLKGRKSKRNQDKIPQIILAHLSKHNNTPAQAFLTVRSLLEEEGYLMDEDYTLAVAVKDTITPVFSV